ncbi:MAG: FG-GAP-like repeat-containing protein [Akkermansiaceae bacterium]
MLSYPPQYSSPRPRLGLIASISAGLISLVPMTVSADVENITVPTSVSGSSLGAGLPYGSNGVTPLELTFDTSGSIPETAVINSVSLRVTGNSNNPSWRSEVGLLLSSPGGQSSSWDLGDDLGFPDSAGSWDTNSLSASTLSGGDASGVFTLIITEDYNDRRTDANITSVSLVIDYDPNLSIAMGGYLNGVFPDSDPTDGGPQPPQFLSQTGAFSSLANLTAVDGLLPYTVNSPLWSDAAAKKRWVAVPTDGNRDSPGEQVTFSPNDFWTFPEGTVAVKHFELNTVEGKPTAIRRLETRFMVVTANDFYGVTYRWNEEGTDAELLPDSASDDITITNLDNSTRIQRWDYPGRADCRACHKAEAGVTLGLNAYQLNGDFRYPGNSTEKNQLEEWVEQGLFSKAIGDVSSLPKAVKVDDQTATLRDRVNSYLAANCSSCHYPGNFTNDFDLRFKTDLNDAGIIDDVPLYPLGIADARVIAPQDPARSVMYFRVETEGIHKMAPISRNMKHPEAVATLEAWINTLSTSSPSNSPVANNDDGLTLVNTPTEIDAFSNDFDPDGDAFTLSESTSPSNGEISWTPAGVVTYTPDQDWSGTDQFSYIIRDAGGTFSNTATVIVVVSPLTGSSSVSFSDRSNLLPDSSDASGVAMGVADMNQDGYDDIVHLKEAVSLFVEYQDPTGGNFTRLSLGIPSSSSAWGMAVGDADNNGFPDIVTGGFNDGIHYQRANNNGTAFTETTLSSPTVFLQAINFADINMDGWLDIFACHDNGENAKWRNDGTGVMISNSSMMDTRTNPASDNSGNYGTVWTDYDNDGDLDLYISKCRLGVSSSNDPRRINQLFQNDGNGNYTEVGAAAGLRFGQQTWSTDFADIDNDGDLDCFVGNHDALSLIMRNNGNGTFTDVTADSGVSVNWDIIQCVFRDFNNDGWIDLFLTGPRHELWLNDGDGTFTEASNPFGNRDIQSCAVGDLNHDGFPDIYAGYASGYNSPVRSQPDKLFLSNTNGNNFLSVTLRGTTSNKLASGARLELHGPWGIQCREVRSGEGYGISHSFSQRFGMGGVAVADRLVIKWPSGAVDTAYNVSANQFLILEEGTSAPPVVTNPGNQISEGSAVVNLAISANDQTNDDLVFSATNLPTGLTINSSTGVISGTTTNGGVFPVTVAVSDGWSEVEISFTWTIGQSDEHFADANTVALYHFNSDYTDSSTNSLDLAVSGSVQLSGDNLGWMSNPTGQVARFGGAGDKLTVSIPDSLLLTAGDSRPLTIEARICPRAWVGFGVGNLPIISLEQDLMNHLKLEDSQWSSNPQGPRILSAGTPLVSSAQWAVAAPLNQWALLEISLDPDAGTVTTWIDSQPVSVVSTPFSVANASAWTLELGNFDGDLDEIYIHRGDADGGGTLPAVVTPSAAVAAETLGVPSTDPLAANLLTDSDGDGIANLVEVATGTDAFSGSSLTPLTMRIEQGGNTEVTYQVPDFGLATSQGYETAAFVYTIEVSEDLINWSPASLSNFTSEPSQTGGYQVITQQVGGSSSNSSQFVRLSVQAR